MLRTMMKSKIHRATVTQADLHYVGSVTVDEDLLEAAEARELRAHVVFVDGDNRNLATGSDPAETWDDPGLVRGDLSVGR